MACRDKNFWLFCLLFVTNDEILSGIDFRNPRSGSGRAIGVRISAGNSADHAFHYPFLQGEGSAGVSALSSRDELYINHLWCRVLRLVLELQAFVHDGT